MGELMRRNSAVPILCIIGIIISLVFVTDLAQKFLVVFTILLFFVAVEQHFVAQNSARAAEKSAQSAADSYKHATQSAADSYKQATYLHLASLWYQIKQRGLECDDFIRVEFTTMFRQEEALTKYRQYHVYAWMSWGHAEDCYLKGYHDDAGFLPSMKNYKELHYAWLSVPKNRGMFSKEFTNWVDVELFGPSVEEKSENSKQGTGLFACSQFKEGDFIGYFDGSLVQNPTQMSLQFGPDFFVEPADKTPFRSLNHSCEANSHFLGRNLYAWRDIQEAAEITIDYNCHEFALASPFECNCGAVACIGKINGYSHLTEEQKKQRERQTCSWLRETTESAS